jgi:hypothetical protein
MKQSGELQESISAELEACQGRASGDLLGWIAAGQGQEALDALLFFTAPDAFREKLCSISEDIERAFPRSGPGRRALYLEFLVHLALSLRSFLPYWHLRGEYLGTETPEAGAMIRDLGAATLGQLDRLSSMAPTVARELLGQVQHTQQVRLESEGVEGELAQQLAAALVGEAPSEYVQHLGRAIMGSNLYRIAVMRPAGEAVTELGNDYAAFLPYAMYLGASFVTSNPPLVDLAWIADPGLWNPVVDRIIAQNGDADDDTLARHATLEVVWANMRLLRPIYLLTCGRMGYVSLQVNPKKHYDADSMIDDALTIYQDLQDRLDGGVPNVVFKLPATFAGLEACRQVAARGLGVNVTVSFGLFQLLPFAKAIAQGGAAVSYLTVFNGRLAFQVRDELLHKLNVPEPPVRIGVREAKQAAAWAGVAIVKRLHRLLTRRGYDLARVRPLVASLRFYQGDDYAALPTPCPDITENLGVSVISVLPMVRGPFDRLRRLSLNGKQVEHAIPPRVLDILGRSEIFRQAYWVGDEEWLPEEDPGLRPANALSLEDEQATSSWAPANEVLTDFIKAYDVFVGRIQGRRCLLTIREQARAGKRLADVGSALHSALTNHHDSTVRETVQLLCKTPSDESLVSLLRSEVVQRRIAEAKDRELTKLYQQALVTHGTSS